jgi:phage-related protein
MSVTNKQDKPLAWLGSSKKDLMALPMGVRKFFGHALDFAQHRKQHSRERLKVAGKLSQEMRDE